jgi:crotonobetainyl-CoA:carnitine CoA-transferase CaiB-like acyl-CoA transferase
MTALDGLRVLDLSRLLPGGFCSLLLADFGADVIKVEDTGAGDYVRADPPAFLALNRGKRSVSIDLKNPQGRDVLLHLSTRADVVLESFRPGVMDRLGVGYARLREENPRLVYCAITGYGQDGPFAARAGHDTNYLARIGLLGLTGDPDGPPVQAAGQIADLGGGVGSDTHREVEAVFAERTRAEWEAFNDEHDCCLEPVLGLDEALASELVRARGMVIGDRLLGTPVKLSRTPAEAGTDGSALGADTDAVLSEAGYRADEIAALRDDGAIR